MCYSWSAADSRIASTNKSCSKHSASRHGCPLYSAYTLKRTCKCLHSKRAAHKTKSGCSTKHSCNQTRLQSAGQTFLQIPLDYQLILLSISAADDQVVLAGHKPVEFLKPVRLAHMLDSCLGAHLAELVLGLLLCSLQGLLICVDSLLLLDQVLLALLIVCSGIGVCIAVQVQLHLCTGRGLEGV